MRNDNEFDTRGDGRRPQVPPRIVFMIISGLFILYSGYNMLGKHIRKHFEKFTVTKEGQCKLRTSDAAEFAIRWEVEFELDDRELYDLYGEEFTSNIINIINFEIKKYYHTNKIFDTLLFEHLHKADISVRNIPNNIVIDTTLLYKYISKPSLMTTRSILSGLGFIESDQDYNYGVYMKPINLIIKPHSSPIVLSQRTSNMLQQVVMEKQKLIRAEYELVKAKEYLEKTTNTKSQYYTEQSRIDINTKRNIEIQHALSTANKNRRKAELHVKRAMEAREKHDAELIRQTRKHILDSIDNIDSKKQKDLSLYKLKVDSIKHAILLSWICNPPKINL